MQKRKRDQLSKEIQKQQKLMTRLVDAAGDEGQLGE